jgi:hypothetical protein
MPHRWAALKGREAWRREPWWAEFWAAFGAMGWSLVSALSHGDVTQRPAFVLLGYVVEHVEFWEASGIVLGVAQIAALALDRRSYRWAAAFVLAWWWLLLAASIVRGDAAAPAWPLFMVNAAINLFSMTRLARRYA